MVSLSSGEEIRYSRQLMLPDIGRKGQHRLKQAKVFIAGIGGLGSISTNYLAAAGVGTLKLVDRDHVGLENLNRQILHHTQDIDCLKTDSAARKLNALNPLCTIEAIPAEIGGNNVSSLIDDCQIIVDATDNLETRMHLNQAAVAKAIPYVYGGIDGFFGMATTFIPGKTPCLACLFLQSSASTGKVGAIGPIPGIIASVQALEVLKIILGLGGLLTHRLWRFNGLDMSVKTTQLERDPNCPCCGGLG